MPPTPNTPHINMPALYLALHVVIRDAVLSSQQFRRWHGRGSSDVSWLWLSRRRRVTWRKSRTYTVKELRDT